MHVDMYTRLSCNVYIYMILCPCNTACKCNKRAKELLQAMLFLAKKWAKPVIYMILCPCNTLHANVTNDQKNSCNQCYSWQQRDYNLSFCWYRSEHQEIIETEGQAAEIIFPLDYLIWGLYYMTKWSPRIYGKSLSLLHTLQPGI